MSAQQYREDAFNTLTVKVRAYISAIETNAENSLKIETDTNSLNRASSSEKPVNTLKDLLKPG